MSKGVFTDITKATPDGGRTLKRSASKKWDDRTKHIYWTVRNHFSLSNRGMSSVFLIAPEDDTLAMSIVRALKTQWNQQTIWT